MNLCHVPITSRSTNMWNETFDTGSHKIRVCTARGRCNKMHELCFRNSPVLVQGATLYIVRYSALKRATTAPRGSHRTVPSHSPVPRARRSHHPLDTCTLAQSAIRLTHSGDDRTGPYIGLDTLYPDCLHFSRQIPEWHFKLGQIISIQNSAITQLTASAINSIVK